MTKTFTGYAIYDDGRPAGPVKFKDDLKWLHDFIGCDCLDMPSRWIENAKYVFIVDDSGLIKVRKPTAFYAELIAKSTEDTDGVLRFNPALFGTLIITRVDRTGEEFQDLNKIDIELIEQNIFTLPINNRSGIVINPNGRVYAWPNSR